MTPSRLAAKTVPLHVVLLENVPIFQQLQWEEALLRTDQRNWCLINSGSPPAIVMGISGQADQLIDTQKLKQKPVPVIKRFSGGGTVFIDHNTVFVSWICNSLDVDVSCCPVQIHAWSEKFYQAALPSLSMRLRENDYVIGERKCGGNAQYLCKGRWLHHTSLLWDYHPENMDYLLMPKKVPAYRKERSHTDFLCRLSETIADKESLQTGIVDGLKRHFHVQEGRVEDLFEAVQKEHRKATQLVEIQSNE